MSDNTKKLVEICSSDHDIKADDVDAFEELIKSSDINWDHRDQDDNTHLHIASMNGHANVVHILSKLEQLDVNVKAKFDTTPLHLACGNGHARIVEILTQMEQCDVNTPERYNSNTSLYLACKNGHERVVEILSKIDRLDVNLKNSDYQAPLHVASICGHERIVDILSKMERLDVNAGNKGGKTAFHLACQDGRENVVEILSKMEQLDVNAKDGVDRTALHLACSSGHAKVVNILAKMDKLDVNLKKMGSATAFDCIWNGNWEHIAPDDIDATSLIRISGGTWENVFFAAMSSNHPNVLASMCNESYVDVNKQHQEDGATALHKGCESRNTELIIALCQRNGLDVNILNKAGKLAMELLPPGYPGSIHYTTLLILNESLKLLVPASERIGSRTVFDIILETEETTPSDYLIKRYLDAPLSKKDGYGSPESDKDAFELLSKIKKTSANYSFTWEAKRELIRYIGVENFVYSKATFISSDELLNIQEIGSGNFGAIYKADLNISRDPTGETQILIPVVCKIAKSGAGEDEWFELQVLQNLPLHNNVMNLVAMCAGFKPPNSDTEVLYSAIIINFRKRGSLLSFLEKKKDKSPFVLQTLCSFGIDIVRAVSHMHEHSYKHCDIAARNFLIGTRTSEAAREITGAELRQQLSITDFGLSRPLNLQHGKDAQFPYLWCAPETLETFDTSVKSDTWMIGITFLELCSFPYNQPYFPGFRRILKEHSVKKEQTNKLRILLNHRKEIGCVPSPIFSQLVPIEWTQIMNDCCAMSPDERPKLTDLLEQLETLSKQDGTYPGSEKNSDIEVEEDDFESDPEYADYSGTQEGYTEFVDEEKDTYDSNPNVESKSLKNEHVTSEEKNDNNPPQVYDRKDDVYLSRYQNNDLTLEEALHKMLDLNAQLAQKDAQLAQKDAQLAQKDTQLAEKDKQISEKDEELLKLRQL